jgi:hypothetical protein
MSDERINDIRWPELLGAATSRFPTFLSLKHLPGALSGRGDFDCAVDPREVESITDWLRSQLYGWSDVRALVMCDHVPDVRLILILGERTFPFVQEIDLAWSLSFRGIRYAKTADLLGHSLLDPSGIRVLTESAQAAVLMMLYGINGRSLRLEGMKPADRAVVEQQLAERPAALKTAVFDLCPAPLAKAVTQTMSDGEGSPEPMRIPYRLTLREPGHLLARVWSRFSKCEVLRVAQAGRDLRTLGESSIGLDWAGLLSSGLLGSHRVEMVR